MALQSNETKIQSSSQLVPRWCYSRPHNGFSTTAYMNTINEYTRQIDQIQNQLLLIIFCSLR